MEVKKKKERGKRGGERGGEVRSNGKEKKRIEN